MPEATGLRERKKQRTRRALIEAAYRLFNEQGYEQTTVAAIAAAADVAPATFYLHFPAKEDLLFADGQHLLNAGIAALAERQPDESPTATLVRAIRQMVAASRGGPRDLTSELEQTRLRLITSVPALQATTLHRVFTAQQQLAEALQRAYPGDIDALDAVALVGAVTGAILAAGHAATTSGQTLTTAIERILDTTDKASRLTRDDR
jgi:AcrR family transcriptional regulator